jgi:2',3'-cyclic-nucleotide 2'-phosphodiesterase (5'-nucleotidase family)
MTSASSSFRILQINDVYELDHLPRLATLIREYQPDISVVAGDFLAPSLLSSLDHGRSMVDVLTVIGITHVCFGNHEADIPKEILAQRIHQSSSPFVWINTNMRQLDELLSVQTQEYVIVETKTENNDDHNNNDSNNMKKRIALLGLLTPDPALYRPGAFAGARIDNIETSTRNVLERLEKNVEDKIDWIVPLTHQSIQDDRTFAHTFAHTFPIICGGHDHEVYDEIVAGNRILKTGMDAQHAGIIDITFYPTHDNHDDDENSTDRVHVQVQIVPTADYPPDPMVQQRVESHQSILRELESARLFRIADWFCNGCGHPNPHSHPIKEIDDTSSAPIQVLFSTKDNRWHASTGTTAIASMLRMGLRAQCAMMNAGAVRSNKDYNNDAFFTWSDLKETLPFATAMIAMPLPGSVLQETIHHSRRLARQDPPAASGGYLHACSNILFDSNDTHHDRIVSIRGQPFDPNAQYWTAFPAEFLRGIDNHAPLLEWARLTKIDVDISDETAIPAKMLIVQVFSSLLWLQLGTFQEIDRNHDGVISRDEVKAALREKMGNDVSDLVVDGIFEVADMNGDGTITPLEMAVLEFAATDILDHVCNADELHILKETAARVLGMHPSHEQVRDLVQRIREILDVNADGNIQRDELLKKAMGDLQRTDLLH